MRVRALLVVGAAGVVALALALVLRSEALALAGTVFCLVSFSTLFSMVLHSEARRFKPKVHYDHSFLTWPLGETSTPHPGRGATEHIRRAASGLLRA